LLHQQQDFLYSRTDLIVLTKYICNGATGVTGPTGLTGPQGPAGPQGVVGTNGTNGTNGYNTLVKTTTELAGANCATGGTKVEVGLDINGNGILDAAEIISAQTKYICNGATGSQGPPGSSNQLITISNYTFPNNDDYYWGNAISFSSSYSYNGYNDWHIPSQEEMVSLIRLFGSSIFPSGAYWTSTSIAGGLNYPTNNFSFVQPIYVFIGDLDFQGNPIGPIFTQKNQYKYNSNNPDKAKIVLVR